MQTSQAYTSIDYQAHYLRRLAAAWLDLIFCILGLMLVIIIVGFIDDFISTPLDLESPGFLKYLSSFPSFLFSLPAVDGFFTSWPALKLLVYWFWLYLLFAPYFIFLESSTMQATLGKQVFGLKVTNKTNTKITLLQATWRHLSRMTLFATFGLGHLMILITQTKQGLHDLISQTAVVYTQQNDTNSLPKQQINTTASYITRLYAAGFDMLFCLLTLPLLIFIIGMGTASVAIFTGSEEVFGFVYSSLHLPSLLFPDLLIQEWVINKPVLTAPIYLLCVYILYAPYFILLESSSLQGTLGKHFLGLKVVNRAGQQLTIAQAIGRYLGRIFVFITLGLSHAAALFNKKQQTCHDFITQTHVVHSQQDAIKPSHSNTIADYFYRRLFAACFDIILILIALSIMAGAPVFILILILGPFMALDIVFNMMLLPAFWQPDSYLIGFINIESGFPIFYLSINFFVLYLFLAPYSILLESSPLQGTLGKRLFGLKVVNQAGNKVSIRQAIRRYFSKILLFVTFGLDYIALFITKEKKALVDRTSHTNVVKRSKPSTRLP